MRIARGLLCISNFSPSKWIFHNEFYYRYTLGALWIINYLLLERKQEREDSPKQKQKLHFISWSIYFCSVSTIFIIKKSSSFSHKKFLNVDLASKQRRELASKQRSLEVAMSQVVPIEIIWISWISIVPAYGQFAKQKTKCGLWSTFAMFTRYIFLALFCVLAHVWKLFSNFGTRQQNGFTHTHQTHRTLIRRYSVSVSSILKLVYYFFKYLPIDIRFIGAGKNR